MLEYKEQLLKLYPEYSRALGPYYHKGLDRWVIYLTSNSWKNRFCMTNAKGLMESKIGRRLLENEEVDHIDNNRLNDIISNLQILTKKENRIKAQGKKRIGTFTCPECNKEFIKYLSKVKSNRKQGKAGPFCHRTCAGKYSRRKVLSKDKM